MAHSLSWGNVLEPWIWPPFYKIFVGLGLHLYGDLFVVPRVLVGAAGLITIIALVHVADAFFADRWINLGTAVLAVFVQHRLVLSVVPMSDIYFFLFVIISSVFVVRWLKQGKRSTLLLASTFLFLAATVRYEACFFIASLMLVLGYRLLIKRDIDFPTVIIASSILMAFPIFWTIDLLVWYGSLKNSSDNRDQVIAMYGADHLGGLSANELVRFLRNVAIIRVLIDLACNPLLLLGLVALFRQAGPDRSVRNVWAVIFFAPLVVESVVQTFTMNVPLAASWRVSGIWTLLLLPFTSFALWRYAHRIPNNVNRVAVFAVGLAVGAGLFAARSGQIISFGLSSDGSAREVALYIKQELAKVGHGKVLLDSVDNCDFLYVLAENGAPEAFVLNAGDDPLVVANYFPLADKLRKENDGPIVERYLTDRFALDRGGSADEFAKSDIRFALVLVRNARFIDGLNQSPLVERVRPFGQWVLYRTRSAQNCQSPG